MKGQVERTAAVIRVCTDEGLRSELQVFLDEGWTPTHLTVMGGITGERLVALFVRPLAEGEKEAAPPKTALPKAAEDE